MTGIFKGYGKARGKLLIVIIGLLSASLIIAACGGESEGSGSKPGTQVVPSGPVADTAGTASRLPVVASEASTAGRATSNVQYNASQQLGIWVTGRGEVTTTPDLAILNAGVEARADTVQKARTQAAEAMSQIVRVLNNRGIEQKDIQTSFFNISPEYVWDERKGQQELVGYIVNNQVSVKIREIDDVGLIIDEVAGAGGDLVRIQGISFTVEDTEALESQAREKAVQALMAKARQFAQLAGVQLGKPVFLTESGGFSPRVESFGLKQLAGAFEAQEAATPISGGELRVTVDIQGTFSIIE